MNVHGPGFTRDALPDEILFGGIMTPLAQQDEIFSIVSLGTASKALNDRCRDLLAALRGEEQDLPDLHQNLRDYSRWRKLTLTNRGQSGPVLRAIEEILKRAWNQPAAKGLLPWITADARQRWNAMCLPAEQAGRASNSSSKSAPENDIPVSPLDHLANTLKDAVDRAVQSNQDIAEVVRAAAQVQLKAKDDLGLEAILVEHFPSLSDVQQLALLNEWLVPHAPLLNLGALPLSADVARQWLNALNKSGQLAQLCSKARPLGVVCPYLRLIEFVCRRFPLADWDSRKPYLDLIADALEQAGQLSRVELQALMRHLDADPQATVRTWVDEKDRLPLLARALQAFSQAPNRDFAELAHIEVDNLAHFDVRRLDLSRYLMALPGDAGAVANQPVQGGQQPANAVQAGNSSNSNRRPVKRRKKKPQNCSMM